MARTIQLPSDLDSFVDRMIESGRYGSADDLIGDALDLLRQQAEDRAAEEALLLGQIDGEPEADIPAEDVFAELRAKVHAAEKRHAAE